MRRDVINWLTFGIVMLSADGAEKPPQAISVLVYNYAGVGARVLAGTEVEASRIYGGAGVAIEWLHCPLSPTEGAGPDFDACRKAGRRTNVAVRILPQAMALRYPHVEDSFGFALYAEDGALPTIANVFAYDAQQLSNRSGIRMPVILGHVVAHEIGHLLLGAGSHSREGLMCAHWRVRELALIARGAMRFSDAETGSIRINIGQRAGTSSDPPLQSHPAPQAGTEN